MSDDLHPSDPAATVAGYVAALLPPTAPPPEPARRVNFLKAFMLFWLIPKRLGPHLAVAPFRRAVGAHLLAVLVATVVVAGQAVCERVGEMLGDYGLDPSLHTIRYLLADAVLNAAAESAITPWSWAPVIGVVGALPLLQALVLLLGTATMPWAAGGDRASSVWKRSVKNVYWSTTFFVPAAVVFVVLRNVDPEHVAHFDVVVILGSLAVLLTGAVFFLRMLMIGAHRYVGDPDGPAFAPREPVCDQCGYAIVHLPLDTRCPECGLPVRDSLPGGRRQPTAWQRYELRPRGFVELARLQSIVLRDPGFFQRVPVQSGLAAARHFWWGTFLLMVLCTLGLGWLAGVMTSITGLGPGVFNVSVVSVLCAPVPFILQALAMFPACLWAQLQCGVRDYRVSAVACYYATPLLWPLTLSALAAAIVLLLPDPSPLETGFLGGGWSDPWFWLWAGVVCVCVGAFIWSLLFWLRRLLGAVKAVRYANV